jgi:arginase family enzyme
MHGMPLALLGGLDDIKDFRCLDLSEDLLHVGLSSYEPAEALRMHSLRIPHIPHTASFVEDIPRIRIDRPIWLSLDVDALDSSVFGSTGYNEDALSLDYVVRLIKHLKP